MIFLSKDPTIKEANLFTCIWHTQQSIYKQPTLFTTPMAICLCPISHRRKTVVVSANSKSALHAKKMHDKDILRPTRKILQFTALQRNLPLLLIVHNRAASISSNTFAIHGAFCKPATISLSDQANRMRHIRPAIIPLVLRLAHSKTKKKQYKLWWRRSFHEQTGTMAPPSLNGCLVGVGSGWTHSPRQ